MRILNVTETYAPFFEFGGPPVKVRALAEGLVRRGHQVTVLTADWGVDRRSDDQADDLRFEPSPFGKEQIRNGVLALYLPILLRYRTVTWNPRLARFLRREAQQFDVVHIYGLYDLIGPRVAAECRKRRIPYVVEPIGMFDPMVRNIWLKRFYHALWGREMLRGARVLIATSDQERDELLRGGIGRERIVLRRNGVVVPDGLPPRGLFRSSLKISPRAQLVLFLGRLSEKKSPALLLQAFLALATAVTPGAEAPHLAFVGPAEAGMLERLRRIASRSAAASRVHFLGPVEGPSKWSAYRDADVFVLPSQNENFGNTAAEAVAAGTPVIVTDRCGIAPLLRDVAGLVVRHEEAELRRALEQMLSDEQLRERLRAGCPSAVRKLGWEEPLDELNTLYCSLAARSES